MNDISAPLRSYELGTAAAAISESSKTISSYKYAPGSSTAGDEIDWAMAFDGAVAREARAVASGRRPAVGTGDQRWIVVGFDANQPCTFACIAGEDRFYEYADRLDPRQFTYVRYADRKKLEADCVAAATRARNALPKDIVICRILIPAEMQSDALAIIEARGGVMGNTTDKYHERRDLLPAEGGIAVIMQGSPSCYVELLSLWPGWAVQTRAAILHVQDALGFTSPEWDHSDGQHS